MLVREVMTSPVVSVGEEEPLTAVVRLLDHNDITAVPVVDDERRLVGIVSEADILRAERFSDDVVADVMTRRVLSVRGGADVADVADLMVRTGVKSLPVTRGSVVVGIVSRRDVVHVLAASDDRIQVEIHDLLMAAGLKAWTAAVDDGRVALIGEGDNREAGTAMSLARTVTGVAEVHLVPSHGPSPMNER